MRIKKEARSNFKFRVMSFGSRVKNDSKLETRNSRPEFGGAIYGKET